MSVRLLARLQKLEAVLKPQPKARIFRLDLDERDGGPADQEARIAAFKAEHDVQPHDVLVILSYVDGGCYGGDALRLTIACKRLILRRYFAGIAGLPCETGMAWTYAKKALSFAKLTNDGDDEGALFLDRLPSQSEAEMIRRYCGILKKRDMGDATPSEAQLAARAAFADRRRAQIAAA